MLRHVALAGTMVALAACTSRTALPGVDDSVRAFLHTVAHDVTQDGPAAWRKHFSDSPNFFMAANGSLAFPDSAAATSGIQNLTHTIKHIELQWGDELRVDPLTPTLAAVATPWHEVMVDAAGNRLDENGYFTAIAEYREGQWKFRNAHWSAPVPAPAVR
jgi:hypothetical protein